MEEALVHRPSRFDRVFTLPLPEAGLRQQYLQWALPELAADALHRIVRQTDGWSMAYLNELRTTAGILAVDRDGTAPAEADVMQAFEQLSAQFQAGRKNHQLNPAAGRTGFGSAV
jgi:ATP-dependent 26S proteasome regulatory subunit